MDVADTLAMTASPPPRPTVSVPAPSAPLVAVGAEFDDLYRAEHEPMVRLAFLLCGDRETALEVVHDAFVVTCERWSRLDRPGAYLRTTVVNRCRDLGRRRRFRSDAPVPDRADSAGGDDYLADAIAALPPKRRAAVVLRYYLDLSEAEIAATLGVRPGTVKSLLSRGLDQLRRSLADDASASSTSSASSALPAPAPTSTPDAVIADATTEQEPS